MTVRQRLQKLLSLGTCKLCIVLREFVVTVGFYTVRILQRPSAHDSIIKMAFRAVCLALFLIICISQAYSHVEQEIHPVLKEPYTSSIEDLQTKIKYQFKDKVLLTKALTHASFSHDNNGALNILGTEIIKAAISFRYVWKNYTISKGDLNFQMSNLSNCDAVSNDAFDMQLHELIRVAPKVDPKAKIVVCGCYRSLFGAIGVDAKNLDVAKEKFWIRQGWSSIKNMQKHFPQQDRYSESLDAFE